MPRLTAKNVGSLREPGFYGDGEGVFESRFWWGKVLDTPTVRS
jgi:hypothetical protein